LAFPFLTSRFSLFSAQVAWTTTPWTMPSNVALCVHPELTYVKARSPKGEIIIVAESRLPYLPGAPKPAKGAAGAAAGAAGGGADKPKGPPKGGGKNAKGKPGAAVAAPQPAAADGDAAADGSAAAAAAAPPVAADAAAAAPEAAPAVGYTVLSRMKGTELVGTRPHTQKRIAASLIRSFAHFSLRFLTSLQACAMCPSLSSRWPPRARAPSPWWLTRT
jgi:hypothetical protein